ncbi:DUF1572 family protein [Sphingobacterium sp. SYP-B4668]|uniref:DUF1572 family protein n=1 Tax=Sphingobacterium sp. SYP-B4668 TaxID=2996035 RepID=UPI0022DCFD5B|nr:DUF1572 family protein [Sphingobacterium sp. SYP-B4668]
MMSYLESARKQFEYYKNLGDCTFQQLTDEQLFWKFNAESNSIAMLINHLAGNMHSRWTDFLHSDGEKEWRNRDAEFAESGLKTRKELMEYWTSGWQCLFDALTSVGSEDLERIVFIRNQGHTVMEAINRQLAHYPYHIGQIVMIGKMMCNTEWESLSIPRGSSNEYNRVKFSNEKHVEHFTDEILKSKKAH